MRTTIAVLLTALLLAMLPAASGLAQPIDRYTPNSDVAVSDQTDQGGATDWVLIAVLSGGGILLVVGGRFVYSHTTHRAPPTRPAGTH